MAKTIGKGPCVCCGAERPYKENQRGHLYVFCAHPGDGGCGGGFQSRTDHADTLLAAKVTQWSSKEEKAKWLKNQPAPEPEELDEEIEQAMEADEIQEVRDPVPPPAPPAPAARPAPKKSAAAKPAAKPPARRQTPPPAPQKLKAWYEA